MLFLLSHVLSSPCQVVGSTRMFSHCLLFMMEWGHKLSLRPFNHSLCPYHLPSHPVVLSRADSISRLIALWWKDLTCRSAIAHYCGLLWCQVFWLSLINCMLHGVTAGCWQWPSHNQGLRSTLCVQRVYFSFSFVFSYYSSLMWESGIGQERVKINFFSYYFLLLPSISLRISEDTAFSDPVNWT